MKITALIEDTCETDLPCEHGLSLLIETLTHTILFDMGQTALFAENAARLGIDLNKVDCAVLSHGHYDHGGGLSTFLSLNSHAKVYLSRYAFEPHYNGTDKYIGLDTSLQGYPQLVLTNGVTEIDDGLTLHACNDREKVLEFGSCGLNGVENGRLVPDNFSHEQILLLEEDGHRILISGCSHKGIHNIMAWFRPQILVGGFHFSKFPTDERLRELAEQLSRYDTEYYTCHCTGVEQYRYMKQYMPRLHYLSTGQTIEL